MNITDQAAIGFLSHQAAYIEPIVYRTKFEDIDYTKIATVDSSAGEFTKTIEFYSQTGTGRPQWFDSQARDVPLVSGSREKFSTQIHMAAIGYGYDNFTLGYAQKMGVNLQADDAITCRRVYEEFIDDLVKIGDTSKGITGVYNDATVGAGFVSGGTAPARLASAKTPAVVLADLNEGLTSVLTQSLRVEKADTVLMDISLYRDLATTMFSVDAGRSILQAFIDGNPGLTVMPVGGLATAGAGGTRRIVFYRNGADVLKTHIPVPLKFLEVMRTGPMMYEVPGYFRTAGLEIRLPGAMRYRDGL